MWNHKSMVFIRQEREFTGFNIKYRKKKKKKEIPLYCQNELPVTTYAFRKWIFIECFFSSKPTTTFDTWKGTLPFSWCTLPATKREHNYFPVEVENVVIHGRGMAMHKVHNELQSINHLYHSSLHMHINLSIKSICTQLDDPCKHHKTSKMTHHPKAGR